jgi:hypothetical protein
MTEINPPLGGMGGKKQKEISPAMRGWGAKNKKKLTKP